MVLLHALGAGPAARVTKTQTTAQTKKAAKATTSYSLLRRADDLVGDCPLAAPDHDVQHDSAQSGSDSPNGRRKRRKPDSSVTQDTPGSKRPRRKRQGEGRQTTTAAPKVAEAMPEVITDYIDCNLSEKVDEEMTGA
ncbi:ATPase-AAA-core domain-containing protein [Fusarium sp. LHS14.1]|nr:ATPase-AAA-core domain-containing protein [Fusarium sp. LHS14.1]